MTFSSEFMLPFFEIPGEKHWQVALAAEDEVLSADMALVSTCRPSWDPFSAGTSLGWSREAVTLMASECAVGSYSFTLC